MHRTMHRDSIPGPRRINARLRLLTGIATLTLAGVGLSSITRARAQDGSTDPSDRSRPVVAREVTLDAKVNAVLHLSFLISRPLVDGQTKEACRVASVLGFTDVNGRIQYDLAHASPAVAGRGSDPIEFVIGYDEGGASGDYRVRLEPAPRMTWSEVIDVEDLTVSTTRL